ncbi:MAG TPA: hypothetical protein VIY47_08080, partial [Ignavibacteriaceae bacterium]
MNKKILNWEALSLLYLMVPVVVFFIGFVRSQYSLIIVPLIILSIYLSFNVNNDKSESFRKIIYSFVFS